MIFFVAMPLVVGLMNFAVPLQLGVRDVAFPVLNSVSLWLTATGALLINLSLVIGNFARTGWMGYRPLSELAFSPDVGVDYYLWSLQISGVGTLLTGINFVTTILKLRAPGMTYFRMPVFCWTALAANLLIVAAFPILTATFIMLLLDRYVGMHFFTNDAGGNQMMYVNLFWAWGHPEVYILILPAFDIFSEVVATFSGKGLFSYRSMVWATLGILSRCGCIIFSRWERAPTSTHSSGSCPRSSRCPRESKSSTGCSQCSAAISCTAHRCCSRSASLSPSSSAALPGYCWRCRRWILCSTTALSWSPTFTMSLLAALCSVRWRVSTTGSRRHSGSRLTNA
jgi:hypothetical protein